MAAAETFERGDEVLSKLASGPIMTVLAVEGMKARCSDEENRQYWFDTKLLERYHWRKSSGQDSLSGILAEAALSRSSSERQQ